MRRVVLMLAAGLMASAACGAVPTPTPGSVRPDAAGVSDRGGVRRVRFEEDRVTCYVSITAAAMRCLRDAP